MLPGTVGALMQNPTRHELLVTAAQLWLELPRSFEQVREQEWLAQALVPGMFGVRKHMWDEKMWDVSR